jgi:PIN domain nuclease of toxin-antitoxin system
VILLDTQVAVWMTIEARRLSGPAVAAIREASREGRGIAIADATLWEIAMISRNGQVRLRRTLSEYLAYLEEAFVVLPITGRIAEISVSFPEKYPKDPTDRLIGATAVAHGLQLVTKDEGIRGSGEVNCVW